MPAGATYEPIATTTLGSNQQFIDFTSIGSGYTDLRIVVFGKSASDYASVGFRLNGDTGSNYSSTRLYGTGGAAASQRIANSSYADISGWNGFMTSQVSMVTMDLFSYAGSTNKTALGTAATDLNGSGAVERVVSLWRSTAAVTSIRLMCAGSAVNFASGTTATLYGIKNSA